MTPSAIVVYTVQGQPTFTSAIASTLPVSKRGCCNRQIIWMTSTRIMWCEILWINTSSPISSTKGPIHVVVFITCVYRDHVNTSECWCILCATRTQNNAQLDKLQEPQMRWKVRHKPCILWKTFNTTIHSQTQVHINCVNIILYR